jgi:hypothetical protein
MVDLEHSYSALSAAAKVAYTGETATVVVTDIQKALERYVYIVNKYGYTNFMGITIEGASSTSLDISRSNSVSTIVLIAVAGFTAIGGMFFLKRKEQSNSLYLVTLRAIVSPFLFTNVAMC